MNGVQGKCKCAFGLGLVLVLILLVAVACGSPTQEPTESPVGMPNPASAHCEKEGGKLDIRADSEGNQYGICIFDDGSECEEWAFFRGECEPGEMERVPEPN